ncbi:phage shock protein C (PspC) family protein [Nocardia alba]|uniref:Phage shock protein C (PspC) family protein n=2 Tax=Nocardia alba TaxID=225051 RepID=A0A4V2PAQ7_9NOCA|nr:phage shock protein C (PspC) family protein [Nocardia alba]
MWHTRPVRLPRQGPIAGVAAGFGLRYGVDPVLVRVAFVVSTIFGGAGIVLYLLAWLVLGSAGNEMSAAQALSDHDRGSHSQTKTIVLIVALAIAVSTMGPIGLGMGGSGVVSLGLMLAGWWMLYLRHPELPAGFDAYRAPLGTTGYPGAGYPTGVPVRGYPYNPEVPPTGMYTPYTKLPDVYVPDPALAREENRTPTAESAPLLRVDVTDTVVLRKEIDETGGSSTDSVETARITVTPAASVEPAATDSGRRDPEHEEPNNREVASDAQSSPTPHAASDTSSRAVDSVSPVDLDKRADSSKPELIENTDRSMPPVAQSQNDAGATALLREDVPGTISPAPEPPRLNAQVPNGWDPLAVAPLAWELPEAAPRYAPVTPPTPKRPRSRLTPVTIGLAILAAALAGAAAASGVEWMTPARIAAFALAVVGLGLVVGAFLRRGYGLLILTAPLAGFVVLASLIGPIDFKETAVGDRVWAPTSMTELQPRYALDIGSGTLDLRGLNLTESRSVEVAVNIGDTTVQLPEGMTVNMTCDIRVTDSNSTCRDGLSGPKTPGAPVLDLRVKMHLGDAVVTRG